MKSLFTFLLCVCVATFVSRAQEIRGFLNMVNMVPGDALCEMTLNGQKISPLGIPAGSSSGWFSLPVEQMILTAEVNGSRPASQSIGLADGFGKIYVIYPKLEKRAKPDKATYPPRLKIATFPAYEARSLILKIVSFYDLELPFTIGGQRIAIPPMKVISLPNWTGQGFTISHEGKVIGTIPEATENSNYYIFISPAADGSFFTARANADQLSSGKPAGAKP